MPLPPTEISKWNRLHFSKDPDTGKRNSRLNPEDRVTQVTVPHLRIIDDALWDQVKARQGAMKTKNTEVPIWDRRRPKFLFSGLMTCGCCGGWWGICTLSAGSLLSEGLPVKARQTRCVCAVTNDRPTIS